jgi:GcrA cell cycle regulator
MPVSSAPFWTIPVNLEALKKEVKEGGSASEIAARLSRILGRMFSRNSIVGACHRHIKEQWAGTAGAPRRAPGIIDKGGTPRQPRRSAPFRAKPAPFRAKPAPAVKSSPVKSAVPVAPTPVDLSIPIDDRGAWNCTLMELQEGKCKWPIGDPRAKDFCYCGDRAVPNGDGNLVFCGRHARIAYVPSR